MANFADALFRLWPNGDEKIKGLRAGMIASAPSVFVKYGIDSPIVLAQLMAQISHECGAGHDVVENLSYSAQRLIEVWPRHFNASNAADYAHNPQKLANFIYNPPQHTDLGNRSGSNDGWTYRGRGATQTTGRDGYDKLGRKVGLDLLGNPDLVNDPAHFLECGVADFILCGCLAPAKADDILTVTKRLNGGTVGLSEREQWLAKWKAAAVPVPIGPIVAQPSQPATPIAPKPVEPPKVPPVTPAPPAPPQGNWLANLFTALLSIFRRK